MQQKQSSRSPTATKVELSQLICTINTLHHSLQRCQALHHKRRSGASSSEKVGGEALYVAATTAFLNEWRTLRSRLALRNSSEAIVTAGVEADGVSDETTAAQSNTAKTSSAPNQHVILAVAPQLSSLVAEVHQHFHLFSPPAVLATSLSAGGGGDEDNTSPMHNNNNNRSILEALKEDMSYLATSPESVLKPWVDSILEAIAQHNHDLHRPKWKLQQKHHQQVPPQPLQGGGFDEANAAAAASASSQPSNITFWEELGTLMKGESVLKLAKLKKQEESLLLFSPTKRNSIVANGGQAVPTSPRPSSTISPKSNGAQNGDSPRAATAAGGGGKEESEVFLGDDDDFRSQLQTLLHERLENLCDRWSGQHIVAPTMVQTTHLGNNKNYGERTLALKSIDVGRSVVLQSRERAPFTVTCTFSSVSKAAFVALDESAAFNGHTVQSPRNNTETEENTIKGESNLFCFSSPPPTDLQQDGATVKAELIVKTDDDLRQEALAMQLIHLMNELLDTEIVWEKKDAVASGFGSFFSLPSPSPAEKKKKPKTSWFSTGGSLKVGSSRKKKQQQPDQESPASKPQKGDTTTPPPSPPPIASPVMVSSPPQPAALRVCTYGIQVLSADGSGIVEAVSNSTSIHRLMDKLLQRGGGDGVNGHAATTGVVPGSGSSSLDSGTEGAAPPPTQASVGNGATATKKVEAHGTASAVLAEFLRDHLKMEQQQQNGGHMDHVAMAQVFGLAAACVSSYVLNLKDRHNGNILLCQQKVPRPAFNNSCSSYSADGSGDDSSPPPPHPTTTSSSSSSANNNTAVIFRPIHIDYGFFLNKSPGGKVFNLERCGFKLHTEFIETWLNDDCYRHYGTASCSNTEEEGRHQKHNHNLSHNNAVNVKHIVKHSQRFNSFTNAVVDALIHIQRASVQKVAALKAAHHQHKHSQHHSTSSSSSASAVASCSSIFSAALVPLHPQLQRHLPCFGGGGGGGGGVDDVNGEPSSPLSSFSTAPAIAAATALEHRLYVQQYQQHHTESDEKLHDMVLGCVKHTGTKLYDKFQKMSNGIHY